MASTFRKPTMTCATCKRKFSLNTSNEKLMHWFKYRSKLPLIQDFFPELDVSEREIVLSQTCGKCFDKMYSEEPEESDLDKVSS